MTQNELAARMAAEEEAFRKTCWAYHLDRGVMELLAPLLEGLVGADFAAYVQAQEDQAQAKNWTAYQTGRHLGEVAVKKDLPPSLCDALPIETLVGGISMQEGSATLQRHMQNTAAADPGKFLELYDLAALEIQGIQEIRAGLWGLQDSGASEAWVREMSGYLPGEQESPDWL